MMTYIALYKAKNQTTKTTEQSCFTWQQESGDIDTEMLTQKIKRERSLHYFNLMATEDYQTQLDDIIVTIEKTDVFRG
ncbi:GTP-binding protein LepA [Cellulophaga sp. HaHaR_3_176]|uniref:GTP-binding protein LepA n=1 Tax=Cellulophaga sp. HaHaR_3_176 TaxID=1942464 RepID=UPI001C1F2339|nr:GTP-binding protein LepA [Cellulophaga sp. HaHaR_3_176]QWX84670.1 GTP-binding protein LepA [Cellulophaga sp. HaHaR_3_176]